MTQKADLVIKNISEIWTFQGPDSPRTRDAMNQTGSIKHGAIAVKDRHIVWLGPESELNSQISNLSETECFDAGNKAVIPGFVEPHTHLVFGGTREKEFAQKIAGVPYMQIAAEGGGIKRSVRQTRNASEEELLLMGLERIREALKLGITTLEIKSGYGLDFDTEIKILSVAQKLNEMTPVNIVTTFLGAHEIPQEQSREAYLDCVCNEMIPYVAENNLARFCDVFCEKGVYTLEEAERVLRTGIKYGLKPKIHADQMTPGGGAELAGKLHAVSADHLDYTGSEGMKALADSGAVAVLLPGAVFFLGLKQYPPARKMIHAGVPVALSTDFNPGSCMSLNIHLMMTIANVTCRMTIPEAYNAVTINAACALDLQDSVGSLKPGKLADIVILDCDTPEMVPYHFGHNHVQHVFCAGKHIVKNGIPGAF